MNRARLLPCLLVLLASPSLLSAQIPQGDEFQVNVRARTGLSEPLNVAMNARGEFVVVWHAAHNLVTKDDGLFARWFAADGTPGSGEILVSDQDLFSRQAVAIRDDGSYLVLYFDQVVNQRLFLKGRLFAPDGTPLSDILTIVDDFVPDVSVAVREDGGFAVAWSEKNAREILYRLIGPGGEILGPPKRLGFGYGPSITVGPEGEMVAVWDLALPSDRRRLQFVGGQRLRPDGSRPGPFFRAARRIRGDLSAPSAAFTATGDFLVVWSDALDLGVFMRRFGKNGAPSSRVRRLVAPGRAIPRIALNQQNGEFVLVWETDVNGVRDMLARRFDRNGSPLGPVAFVGTFSGFHGGFFLRGDRVASDGAGSFVVVWQNQDRILARVFRIE